jgi:hypothetical protein
LPPGLSLDSRMTKVFHSTEAGFKANLSQTERTSRLRGSAYSGVLPEMLLQHNSPLDGGARCPKPRLGPQGAWPCRHPFRWLDPALTRRVPPSRCRAGRLRVRRGVSSACGAGRLGGTRYRAEGGGGPA